MTQLEISANIKDDYLKWLQEIGIPLNLSESDFDKGMDTLTKARKLKKFS